MSYVGVAAAIGRPVNIPVLVRSLAHDLYRVGYDPYDSFKPDLDLMVYLDGELSGNGPDDPHLRVPDYHLRWWMGTVIPTKYTELLSYITIRPALHKHRKFLEDLLNNEHQLPRLSVFNKPAYSWHPEIRSGDAPDCTRCRLYCAVSLGALDSLSGYTEYGPRL